MVKTLNVFVAVSFDGKQRKQIHEREGNWQVEEYAPKMDFSTCHHWFFSLRKQWATVEEFFNTWYCSRLLNKQKKNTLSVTWFSIKHGPRKFSHPFFLTLFSRYAIYMLKTIYILNKLDLIGYHLRLLSQKI